MTIFHLIKWFDYKDPNSEGISNQNIWSIEKFPQWQNVVVVLSHSSYFHGFFSSRWFVKKCADGSLRAHLSSWMREPTDQGQSRKIQTDVLEHISMDIFEWKISLTLYVYHIERQNPIIFIFTTLLFLSLVLLERKCPLSTWKPGKSIVFCPFVSKV